MTAWAYMIVFDDAFATRQKVQDLLDKIPEVTFWFACMPNCIFVTARLTAKTLAARLENAFDVTKGQKYIVTELAEDKEGRLPQQAWHLIGNPNNPRLKSD